MSAYERRLWTEVDRILYQKYLSPRTVTDFWIGDREAVVWHLRQMKERVIRLLVISEYVDIDDSLNRAILERVRPRGTRERTVIFSMLTRLFMRQKIEYLSQLRRVPSDLRKNVLALNDLRNVFAHRAALAPKSKRLYKGKHDLFTKAGLSRFEDEMGNVRQFLDPVVMRAAAHLVRTQKRSLQRQSLAR